MDSKVCRICGEEKPVSEFYQTRSGYVRNFCKPCERARSAAYKAANREKVRAGYREYNQRHADKKRAYDKEYVQKNKETVAQKAKAYWSKPENRERKAANKRAQYQADAQFRVLENCRGRIYRALKHNRKSKPTFELAGCSLEQLRSHLESQFQPGMSWDNYGEWHVDHIRPCASFDLSKPDEQQACFHYSNLQPLWGRENILKGDKWLPHSDTSANESGRAHTA